MLLLFLSFLFLFVDERRPDTIRFMVCFLETECMERRRLLVCAAAASSRAIIAGDCVDEDGGS